MQALNGMTCVPPMPAARRPARGSGKRLAARSLSFELQRTAGAAPLFRQIQTGIRAAVLSGLLGDGARLPAERVLAAELGVNRTTVMRAYQELAADGFVAARPGRGTTIALPDSTDSGLETGAAAADEGMSWLLTLPSFGNGALGTDPGALRDIAEMSARPDFITFAAGAPGSDLIPVSALQTALNEALAAHGGDVLGYGPVEGLAAMRDALVAHASSRGVHASAPEVMVLSGATQGLALAARALIEPGDEVVVEAPTYVGILQTFAMAGARVIGVPLDRHGIRLDELSAVLSRRRIRLIVVQPTLHNPTNTTMPIERRERLLALAERHGVPILEDDAYGDLWHDHSGPPSLKALDRRGIVLYVSTFSKTVAPGLRLGWCVGPKAMINRLTLVKQFADLQSSTLSQLAVAGFLRDGVYDRHIRAVRDAYNARRSAMLAAVAAVPGLSVESGNQGGLYVWCALPSGVSARVLAGAAARAGIGVLAGDLFYPSGWFGSSGGSGHIRLSFASQTPLVIGEGLRRLGRLLHSGGASPAYAPGMDIGVRPIV
jgi:2-aminoadipate transaminase